jgi:hypothetical protein
MMMKGRPWSSPKSDDVVVGEASGGAGFLEEAGFGFRIGAAGLSEDLDGHSSAEHSVLGAIDVTHAAAEKLLQLVFSDPCR